MALIILFFAGVFLTNAVPHLSAALRGEPFPSPFAKPPGRGASPPLVNLAWGGGNLLVGLALLAANPVAIAFTLDFAALLVGAALTGAYIATHFGRARAEGTFTGGGASRDKADKD